MESSGKKKQILDCGRREPERFIWHLLESIRFISATQHLGQQKHCFGNFDYPRENVFSQLVLIFFS